MNTYSKYVPNVYLAKCETSHEKGETINVANKYGKENESIVFNLVYQKDGFFYYSIVRADGFNVQERAKAKAERYASWANSAENKSNQYYEASKEGKDFLALAEPIKVGHHSEKRHRALIDRNWERMGKSVAMSNKAEAHESKSDYWASKANDINLSMPESLEYFEFKLEEAKAIHQNLKDNPDQRSHSYSLTYAGKTVKDLQSNIITAVKLWGTDEEVAQVEKEKREEAEAKANKSKKSKSIIEDLGGFFAFNSDQFREGYANILKNGFVEEGEKVTHVGQGLNIPSKNVQEYLKRR
jgi:hypothetical protein